MTVTYEPGQLTVTDGIRGGEAAAANLKSGGEWRCRGALMPVPGVFGTRHVGPQPMRASLIGRPGVKFGCPEGVSATAPTRAQSTAHILSERVQALASLRCSLCDRTRLLTIHVHSHRAPCAPAQFLSASMCVRFITSPVDPKHRGRHRVPPSLNAGKWRPTPVRDE
jgi:hypothetical protein